MVRTMTRQRAVWVLQQHAIHWRHDGAGWLEVLSVWTLDGVPGAEWVPCPGTLADLLAWLNY
jgi:hypothetical protein